MKYKASLDTLAKIITAGAVVLFIAIGQMSVRLLLNANGDTLTIIVHIFVLSQLVLILLLCWLYAPQSYIVNDAYLLINRPIGEVKIKLSEITQVRIITDEEVRGTIRTFAVGGLFGYYGKFHMPKIGPVHFYATQRKNKILITTSKGKKILVTPDDMDMLGKVGGRGYGI